MWPSGFRNSLLSSTSLLAHSQIWNGRNRCEQRGKTGLWTAVLPSGYGSGLSRQGLCFIPHLPFPISVDSILLFSRAWVQLLWWNAEWPALCHSQDSCLSSELKASTEGAFSPSSPPTETRAIPFYKFPKPLALLVDRRGRVECPLFSSGPGRKDLNPGKRTKSLSPSFMEIPHLIPSHQSMTSCHLLPSSFQPPSTVSAIGTTTSDFSWWCVCVYVYAILLTCLWQRQRGSTSHQCQCPTLIKSDSGREPMYCSALKALVGEGLQAMQKVDES